MEQHPVPQDITSYKFRLVGDMTLKQFLEVALGLGFAWLFYASPLNPLIKWPLLIFSAAFGAALAFLPIEERPLDVWITNFFKAIYRPTQYLWRKTLREPGFLKTKAAKAAPKAPPVSPKDSKKLEEYLSSLSFEEEKVDKDEKEKLNKINQFFQEADLVISKQQSAKPAPPPIFYEPKLELEKLEEKRGREELLKESGYLREKPKTKIATEGISVPEEEKMIAPEELPLVEPAEPFAPPLKVKNTVVYQPPPEEKAEPVSIAPSLPMPSTPIIANVLVGMTLTPKEKILPGTIVEIQDKNGLPVRALRSNQLGQFFIATALPNGHYKIEAEHSDYKFAIMEIQLKGAIVPPIKIKAK